MSGEKSQDLYRALDEIDPVKAPEIVHKYEVIMDGIDNALIYGDEKTAKDARDHLDMITDDLIYEQQRADLIEPFEQELDTIAESLGIAVSVPTDIEVSDERPTGFAETYRESELREIFDSYSSREWQDIMDTMLEEGAEALPIPEERQYRVEQLNAIILALEGIKGRIEGSRGVGEDFSQFFEFKETTKNRSRSISALIDLLKRYGVREIVQNGLTIDQLFLKYRDSFGRPVRTILMFHDEAKSFFDSHGRMVDVTNEEQKKEYYLALVKFLRDQHDYQTAQNILEEIMDEEFQSAIDLIPGDHESTDTSESNIRGRLYDKADAKVGKLVKADVIAQWREEGMNREQIEDAKRNLTLMHYERLLHEYAAKHILVGDFGDVEEGQKSVLIAGEKKAFWEQYNDLLDPKGEWFNLKDESWDMILKELVITAPMIILSAGVAGGVIKGISYAGRVALGARGGITGLSIGARAALGATRMATWGARFARGGRIARGAFRLGKLSAQGTSLVVEGFLFELTFQGINEDLLFAQEHWVQQVLWTSAALGLFKGAGRFGARGAEVLNTAIAEVAPKLNSNLLELITNLVAIGHTQVAAMLLLGAVQYMAAGEFEEFWDTFGYQIFHAYVAVGSLTVAHGAIRTAKGTVFRPRVERPKAETPEGEEPKDEGAQEKPGRTTEGTPKETLPIAARIAEAISSRQSQSIEVTKGRDLTSAIETLASEGFKLEATEGGGILAKKGGVEIFLKPTGRLKGAIDGISGKFVELNAIFEANGGKVDGRAVGELIRSMEGTIASLTTVGLPKRLAAAVSLVMLSGCEQLQQLGGGIAGLTGAIPAALATLGLGTGGGVIVRAIFKKLVVGKAIKAEEKAEAILEAAEAADPNAGASALATSLSALRVELKTLKPKINGIEYQGVKVQLGAFDSAIGKLITELGRPQGARKAEIETHLVSAREALTNLTQAQPDSNIWTVKSLKDSFVLSLAAAAIIAALFVMDGAGYFDGNNDEPEIEEIPIGGGGNSNDEEVIEEVVPRGDIVVPSTAPVTAPAPGSPPKGGNNPAPAPAPTPAPGNKEGGFELYE